MSQLSLCLAYTADKKRIYASLPEAHLARAFREAGVPEAQANEAIELAKARLIRIARAK